MKNLRLTMILCKSRNSKGKAGLLLYQTLKFSVCCVHLFRFPSFFFLFFFLLCVSLHLWLCVGVPCYPISVTPCTMRNWLFVPEDKIICVAVSGKKIEHHWWKILNTIPRDAIGTWRGSECLRIDDHSNHLNLFLNL